MNLASWRTMAAQSGAAQRDVEAVRTAFASGAITADYGTSLVAGLPRHLLPSVIAALRPPTAPDLTEAEIASGIVAQHQARTPAGAGQVRADAEDARSRHRTARLSAVLAFDEAKGRRQFATYLASDTTLSFDECRAALKAAHLDREEIAAEDIVASHRALRASGLRR